MCANRPQATSPSSTARASRKHCSPRCKSGRRIATDNSVVYDLVRLLTFRAESELSAVRPDLENLALKSKSPIARQLGFVALIAADKGVDQAWTFAQNSFTPLARSARSRPADPRLIHSRFALSQNRAAADDAAAGDRRMKTQNTAGPLCADRVAR